MLMNNEFDKVVDELPKFIINTTLQMNIWARWNNVSNSSRNMHKE